MIRSILAALSSSSFAFSLVLFSPPFIATSAYAETPAMYYILDGSGSMWGRVDGKLKINIAKEVMTELIEDTPESMHAGISAYGHRKKGDCADIEELVPLGALNKAGAISQIEKISATGMTPISASVKQAVTQIRDREERTTLVLVSDGIETCEKDPCGVVKALKESGVNFLMHVVGFDVIGSGTKQLTCMAEATGGKYFGASDAKQLLSSLKQIKQSVVENKPIVQATPTPTAEPAQISQSVSSTSKTVRVKLKGPGKISFVKADWVKTPSSYSLADVESGKAKKRFRRTLETQILEPGMYQMDWKQTEHDSGLLSLQEVIEVKAGETTEVSLKTGLQLILPQWVKKPRWWALSKPGSSKQRLAWFRSQEPQLVPAGTFDLLWRQSDHNSKTVVLKTITIEPDVLNRVEATTGIHLVRADWVSEKVRKWFLEDVSGGKTVAWFREFQPQLIAPGTYRVVYLRSEHGTTKSILGTVEVKEGQINEFPINTGIRLLPSSGMEKPYRIEFIQLDTNGKDVRRVVQRDGFQPMPLSPGTYKITYWADQHKTEKLTLVESIELQAGNLLELEL